MTEDSRPIGRAGEDTDEDLDEQADTAATDTQTPQQPTADWESDANPYRKRYSELQSFTDRRAQELQEQILRERRQREAPDDPNDPLAAERRSLAEQRQQLEREREWAAVRAEYPPEIVAAYEAASMAWQIDGSPRGALRGFEQGLAAFAQRKAGSAPEQPKLPTREEAVRPRVDTSRSDAPDPDAIKERIAGAKASKDLLGHVNALFGFEDRRRPRS